jgi:hypothetical protein
MKERCSLDDSKYHLGRIEITNRRNEKQTRSDEAIIGRTIGKTAGPSTISSAQLYGHESHIAPAMYIFLTSYRSIAAARVTLLFMYYYLLVAPVVAERMEVLSEERV